MALNFFKTVQSFAQFLWNWKLNGGQLVDQNTANIRAEICVSCHNNKPLGDIKVTGCSSCSKGSNKLLNSVRDSIIKGNRTTSDSRLLACGLCSCDLKIKVWIPLQALGQTKEESNAWPSFCWMKKVLEDKEV